MRGYIPPNTDEERIFYRRVQDVAAAAQKSGKARFLCFLSDRQQQLATAALSKTQGTQHRFFGGIDSAERKMLAVFCVDVENSSFPISTLSITCSGNFEKLTHRDYLGALMALNINRENLGDIMLTNTGALLFCHERFADIIKDEFDSVGRISVSVNSANEDDFCNVAKLHEREGKTAFVASLRLDAVVAAFLNVGRSRAVQIINAKNVQINHIQMTSSNEKVYEGDIFTIKGVGKFNLCSVGSLSKKGRIAINFYKY